MDPYLRPMVSFRFYSAISRKRLTSQDGMKPMVAEQHRCYLLLYNRSLTYIKHSPNYTAFGLPLTHPAR